MTIDWIPDYIVLRVSAEKIRMQIAHGPSRPLAMPLPHALQKVAQHELTSAPASMPVMSRLQLMSAQKPHLSHSGIDAGCLSTLR